MKKISKRNVLCVLMTVMLVMSSLAPGIAMGAEQDGTYDSIGTIFQSDHMEMKITLDGDDLLPDNEELFSGYVQQRFDREIYGDISLFGLSAGDRLPEGSLERNVYEILKKYIKKVADGERESLIFDVDKGLESLSWGLDELGLSGGTYTEKELEQAILNKLKLSETFDFSKVFYCLLTDCPYELYWFDKITGVAFGFNKYGYNNKTAYIVNLFFIFTPAEAYKGTEGNTVDTAKTGAASTAVENAQKIVSQNEALPDIDKLTAYKDAICAAVSYDFYSANESSNTPYGDPWQIISVFDGYTTTKVVCEGYSKAFKYLCDLSEFDGEVNCFLAIGDCGGDHMWNVVEYNDKNYLVDVTNCDEKTVGEPDKLFLVGVQGTDNNKTHIFGRGVNNLPCEMIYTYHESEEDLHCDGYLALSTENPLSIPESVINAVTGYTAEYDGQSHSAVIVGEEASGYTVRFGSSENGPFTDINPQVTNVSDNRTVWVEISRKYYEPVKIPVNVEVMKINVAISTAEISDLDKTYDGTAVQREGNAVIDNDEYKDLESSLTYEYEGVGETYYPLSQEPPVNAGTYKLAVSIPAENKKYKGSAEKKFEISKATIEVKAKNKSVYINGEVPDLTSPAVDKDYTVKGLIGEDQLVGTAVMWYEKDGEKVTPDSKAEAKYDIVISGLSAPAGGNYNEVTPINGVLSIVKKQEALPGAALPPMPLPAAQEPTIQAGEGAKVTLNSDGTTAKITLSDDYELADVTLNGVSKGKITEISGLKTGDKLVVITAKKAVESEEQKLEEIISMLKSRHLKVRSRLTVLKNGKKAVCITWSEENGEDMNFDGVQIFRSVKRYSGYGKKPIYVSKSDRYYNTSIKKGMKYYYKVRGFIEFNGKKYYTDYSTKAIRTVK